MRVRIVNPNGTLIDSEVRMDDIVDTEATTPSDEDVLRYNTSNSMWETGGEPAVALNTTHRGSDGKNHSDVVLNNTHRATSHDYAQITGNDAATDVTAAELEQLTDASVTVLHSHAVVTAYNSRGNITSNDFTKTSFTRDSSWYDLDLSSIVPAGTTIVHFKIRLYAGANYLAFQLRKKGHTEPITRCFTHSLNEDWDYDVWVECDADRVMEYLVQASGDWVNIDVAVRGWM